MPVQPATAAFGELGLTGRLRPAAQARRRLEECAKLGIRTVLGPTESPKAKGVHVVEADTLRGALGAALAEAAREAA